MSRLLKGIELVADGRAPRLVVSEVPPPAGAYAPLAREWAGRVRRRAARWSRVGRIRNTRDEAVAVARLFRERGWSRVLAVTSPVHTRRAAAALEKEGLEVVCGARRSRPASTWRRSTAPGDRRRVVRRRSPTSAIGLFVYRRRGWLR